MGAMPCMFLVRNLVHFFERLSLAKPEYFVGPGQQSTDVCIKYGMVRQKAFGIETVNHRA
jgi:hypothetical protein